MIKFLNLPENIKVIYFLVLCDYISDKLCNTEGYKIVLDALKNSWQWLKTKNVAPDQLYYFLENLDEKDIMTYMQFDKNEKNEPVWICIATALSYIIKNAYKEAGEEYMPETIECVDLNTIKSFFLNLEKININSDISDKLLNYLSDNQKQIDILNVKQFISENYKYKLQ